MPRIPLPARLTSLSLACVLATSSLALMATTPAHADVLSPAGTETITSGNISVLVSKSFPQVIRYTDVATQSSLSGTAEQLNTITINGTEQPVTVTSSKSGETAVDYVLTVPGMGGITLDARLSADNSVVTFNVTKINDAPANQVKTLQLPKLNLATVSSAEPGAQVSTANLSVDRAKTGDIFTPVTATTPVDAAAKGSAYALANTAKLGAAFESNSLYDTSSGAGYKDQGRFWHQAVSNGSGGVQMGVASGQWLYRVDGSNKTEELPWTRVAITPDANADSVVDWQDAAIAMRTIEVRAYKGGQTPDNVITHIPFNFASQATHPFLRTLDDVKRISQATDGLGQVAMLKGYTSEGHDSANTDYGNNFNTRAGGLKDLNRLVSAGKEWNARFGVHINATEIYPEAKSFAEDLLTANKALGWNWLDQSYKINQHQDIISGKLAQRIKELADATDDNLDFAYVDVYYEYGWLAETIQDELVKNGFRVGSEWADHLSRNNTWSHWANDESYGGSANKGVNSQILRFINNTQSDVWNPDARLGVSHIVEFEGWTGQNDFNAFSKNIWTSNLPAKFLQHHEITKWTADRIDLADGVAVTGNTAAARDITVNGASVLKGGKYLLPWASAEGGSLDKLYHYNPDGGSTTWKLTDAFAGATSVQQFKLTDTGRVKVADIPVVNGGITLVSDPAQPYVLVANAATVSIPADASFGEGTRIKDPGFNAADLKKWTTSGDAGIVRDSLGRRYAELGAGASSISQELLPFKAGTYSVSAFVEVEPGRTRAATLKVEVPGGKTQSITIDNSSAINYVAGDEKTDTNFQRVRTLIDVPRNGAKPKITLTAGEGTAKVRADDFRAVETKWVPTTGVLSEDFENVDQGWGPFVKGNAGGSTDPRTHLTERNQPFTQKGWNTNVIDEVLGGTWSLIAHDENQAPDGGPGLVYRTTDATVPLASGRKYKVSFDYQNSKANEYSWVSGYDTTSGPTTTQSQTLGKQTGTARFEQQFTAGYCGDYFVGLQRTGSSEGSDFTLDNVLVEDLGESTEIPACATLTGTLATPVIQQDRATDFTTVLTSTEPAAISNVEVRLALPEGWTAAAADAATAATLPAGGSLTTRWKVTAPASADGSFDIGLTGTYTTTSAPVGPRTVSAMTQVRTLPRPPQATVFASDHPWVSATNGWGPVEKDRSNGEQGAGDGKPLTLNGVTFTKGLGAHAPSTVRYFLGGYCTRFTASVGIDDAQTGPNSSVAFVVKADNKMVKQSPVMGASTTTFQIDADVTGAQYVDLFADAGAQNFNDHADWADARFTCSGTRVDAPPAALSGTVFASDLPWASSTNGWGPAERDQANGEQNAGDGPALKLDGVTYAKGIGVHADADVTIATVTRCQSLQAIVGVDDTKLTKGLHGSVVFIVKGDGVELFRSAVLSADSVALPVNVNITGKQNVQLIADRNGDDAGDDWGDWADAKFLCSP
ncbi:endo-alpha-N-acetylgalactosaminidase family protein [Micrococcaceae bacterium Sec5.7]